MPGLADSAVQLTPVIWCHDQQRQCSLINLTDHFVDLSSSASQAALHNQLSVGHLVGQVLGYEAMQAIRHCSIGH